MNVAPRVSMPFLDLSGVIELWASQCEKLIVYEHISDSQVKKTHCHLLMIGSKVGVEQLKNLAKSCIVPGKGQQFWKWESRIPPDETFITYMSKGKLAPKFIKNISPAEVEEWKLKWIDPTAKSNSPQGDTFIVYKKSPPKTITRKEMLAEMAEKYMRDLKDKSQRNVVHLICQILRKYGFGINPYHVREYYYALVFDDETPFNITVEKCLSIL